MKEESLHLQPQSWIQILALTLTSYVIHTKRDSCLFKLQVSLPREYYRLPKLLIQRIDQEKYIQKPRTEKQLIKCQLDQILKTQLKLNHQSKSLPDFPAISGPQLAYSHYIWHVPPLQCLPCPTILSQVPVSYYNRNHSMADTNPCSLMNPQT